MIKNKELFFKKKKKTQQHLYEKGLKLVGENVAF